MFIQETGCVHWLQITWKSNKTRKYWINVFFFVWFSFPRSSLTASLFFFFFHSILHRNDYWRNLFVKWNESPVWWGFFLSSTNACWYVAYKLLIRNRTRWTTINNFEWCWARCVQISASIATKEINNIKRKQTNVRAKLRQRLMTCLQLN